MAAAATSSPLSQILTALPTPAPPYSPSSSFLPPDPLLRLRLRHRGSFQCRQPAEGGPLPTPKIFQTASTRRHRSSSTSTGSLTSNSAIKALKMLKENKDKFDLIITDAHMPDMDGFKLLELVGLDIGLPVIMLSVNGDTEVVIKGITHGACDYLLKPVRMEELKNIWQHVIRKKKSVPRG